MFHDVRLLMTAVYADEYLVVQIKRKVGWLNIKRTVGWLNQFEPQFATAELAARRGRRLDEGAHVISFCPTCFGTRGRYFNPASSVWFRVFQASTPVRLSPSCPLRLWASRSFRCDRGKSRRCKRSARYSPSDILGRAGDGSNRRYRELFRHGCLKIGSAEEIQNIGPELTGINVRWRQWYSLNKAARGRYKATSASPPVPGRLDRGIEKAVRQLQACGIETFESWGGGEGPGVPGGNSP